jgi:hypothetical protein
MKIEEHFNPCGPFGNFILKIWRYFDMCFIQYWLR